MILETIVSMFYDFIIIIIEGLDVLTLPLDYITFLSNVLVYGIWAVGPGLMSIVIGCVTWWFSARCAVGLAVFIWRLLPFT